MTKNYFVIKDFELSRPILNQLRSLDWQSLPVTLKTDSGGYRRLLLGNLRFRDFYTFVKAYGWNFGRMATMDSCVLPSDLVQKISKEVQEYFSQPSDDLVIRLQIAYNGETVPLHVDTTRTASLIYPLSHPERSDTVFYDSKPNKTHVIDCLDPDSFTESCRINIRQHPVLLDVKVPHAVFLSEIYTKANPRISLSIKWKTLEFNQLVPQHS